MKRTVLAPVLLALAAFAIASPAQAQRFTKLTAGQVGDLCVSKDHGKVETCRAYLDGIADGLAFYQRLLPADGSKGGKLPDYVCIPVATTGPQLSEAYVTWLRAHKDAVSRSAAAGAMNAFNDTYKCPGEPAKP